jgi:VanZ family protein
VRLRLLDLFKAWAPVALWLASIFFASTEVLSSEHTSRFLTPFLQWIAPGISEPTVAQIHFLIRKLAHLTEYAILAGLLLRALRRSTPGSRRAVAIAIVATVLIAIADEYHQSFVPSRTPTLGDVAIDSAGALLGVLLFRRPFLSLEVAKN